MNVFKPMALGLALAAAFSTTAVASDVRHYEVTVTNLTLDQMFAPIMVGTHRPGARLFTLGMPASTGLAAVAEGGNPAPLVAEFGANPKVSEVATSAGPVLPGQTVTIHVMATDGANRLSLASMLVNTNDAFVALDSVILPMTMGRTMHTAVAYDAGSEPNDELCAHIPGPACRGEGLSASAGGEGYVRVHEGVHGVGNISAAQYDWRNPVAQVTVRRMP